MASAIYNIAKTNFANSSVDYLNDDIKIALVYGYTIDVDNHSSFADVVVNEVLGPGYIGGGTSLTTKTISQDNSTDRTYFKADDVNWEGTTVSSNGAIIYKNSGDNLTSPLICYIDFSTVYTTTNQNFIIKWSIDGVFHLR